MLDKTKIKNLQAAERMWPEAFEPTGTIELTNGEQLSNRFGKYQPNICFVLNEKNCSQVWQPENGKLNIDFDGDADVLYGDFWISKKGTKCFRPNLNGSHVLVRNSWGGCFNPTRGQEVSWVKDIAEYTHEARSNGGGAGNTYYIFPANYRREIDVDDI